MTFWPGSSPFRIRFSIANDGDSAAAAPFELYISKNGGLYQAVTTTSSSVKSVDAGSDADETAITVQRLTAP